MKKILVIGANSSLVKETLLKLVNRQSEVFLVARDCKKLILLEEDLRSLGIAHISKLEFDLSDVECYSVLIDKAWAALRHVDLVLIGHGTMPSQIELVSSIETTINLYKINLLSPVLLLLRISEKMESQGSGHIAVFSSIAGDFGKSSNFIYGSAKGGLTIFLQGLRSRLNRKGITISTIKPGPVNTPMTSQNKDVRLMISAQNAGNIIASKILKKREIIYVPWWWSLVIGFLRILPERYAKKLQI